MYTTDDIVLAATLVLTGHSLVKITKDGKKGSFHFNDVDKAWLNEYDVGQVQVEPTAFHAAVRHLTTACKR